MAVGGFLDAHLPLQLSHSLLIEAEYFAVCHSGCDSPVHHKFRSDHLPPVATHAGRVQSDHSARAIVVCEMKSLSLKGASDPIIVGFIGFGLEGANMRNYLSPEKYAICRSDVAAGEGREHFLTLRGQPYYAGYVHLRGGKEPLIR